MLSNDYNKLLFRAVDEFAVDILGSRGVSAYEDQFTLFYPLIGKEYFEKKELLIVGQATNGWSSKFALIQVHQELSQIVEHSRLESTEVEGKCPLEWINQEWTNKKYNLSSSFFWNITYKLVKSFYNRTDTDWNHIIVWSNLMKIAP